MRATLAATCLATALLACRGGARPDPEFRPDVRSPAFARGAGPRVAIDAGHRNRHTLDGRYGPLGALLAADGWRVEPLRGAFTPAALEGLGVLVVAGAAGEDALHPALADAEVEVVERFVRAGGGLLLVADHVPFAEAVRPLARRFGIELLGGEVRDPDHREPGTRDPAQLLFTRGDGTLGRHAILEGRAPDERVDRVVTFTGSALSAPPPAAPLLVLSPAAADMVVQKIVVERGWFDDRTRITLDGPVPTRGNAQAAAVAWGRGRVVVVGEAAVLTAQVERASGRFGLDWPGAHNRRLALNVVRWLGGALPEDGR
ncbi:MAG: hypothetical protein U0229_14830 [Anaeromyxobacter sp.]